MFAPINGAVAVRNPSMLAACRERAASSLETQIHSCTWLIEHSRKGTHLEAIFYSRGMAYYRHGNYTLATADFDEAIMRGYANALYARSLAKEKLGDSVGAAEDFAAFKRLKPE